MADQGALLTVLPMKVVSSTEREIAARISDDSDDREHQWHDVLTTVDIAPIGYHGRTLHTSTVFGVETPGRPPSATSISGSRRARRRRAAKSASTDTTPSAPLFRVCRHCGGVFGIRGDDRNDQTPIIIGPGARCAPARASPCGISLSSRTSW